VSVRLGRPRQVEDAAVYEALVRALLRVGWSRLTLAGVAREVGVTPAALRQRFGSKHELLVVFYARGTSLLEASLTAALAQTATASPLAILSALVLSWVDSFATPEELANSLTAYPEVTFDPRLRRLAQQRVALVHDRFRALLQAALDRGELAGVEAPALARQLHASLVGAFMTWSISSEGTLRQQVQGTLDALLGPYRRHSGRVDGALAAHG
jgi:AcrR family transcriptional regulator